MSIAQKTWPEGGRIRMTRINGTDGSTAQELAGKVALVTGGNRGIGKAIAARLARLGAAVAICGRDAETLAATAKELRTTGARIHSQRADVTKSSDVDVLVNETEAALGPISILVNNAGMGLFGPIQEKTEQEWDTLMNTNLKSVFLMSRKVIGEASTQAGQTRRRRPGDTELRESLPAPGQGGTFRKAASEFTRGKRRCPCNFALLQTPHRFRTKRQLWAYAGLALQTRISGEYRFTGGQLQPSKRLPALRGLNHNHSHDLKNVFKGAATQASHSSDALGDFYQDLLAKA